MRLDLFLTACRLVKRRSAAKVLAEEGGVRFGGEMVRPGRQLQVGDEFEVMLGRRLLRVRVAALPIRRVSKADARELYEVIEEKSLEVEHLSAGLDTETPGKAQEGGDREGPIDFLKGR